MRVRFISRTLLAGSIALGASGLLAVTGLPGTLGVASAAKLPSVVRISPISAPAGTSVPIVIHGHGFDTTAGATTVTFGGVAAVSVSCSAPSKCVAVTPNLPEGSASVVVSVDGAPLNAVDLTVTAYAPPVVQLLTNAKGHTIFSSGHLTDSYPASGPAGYNAFTIKNSTAVDQTLTGSAFGSGTVDIAPGDSQTFSLLTSGALYIATTMVMPTASLTIRTK